MKLATPSQMRALDKTTIEEIGIPGIVLMENAGKGTVDEMEEEFGPVHGKTVYIFIGPGNNGGDGLVIARHVVQRGGWPFLVFMVDPEKFIGDAAVNAAISDKLHFAHYVIRQEGDIQHLTEQIQQLYFTQSVHSLVDALFGTGLTRKIEGRFAAVVRFMNTLARKHQWPIVSVDIPSGLSAQTGTPLGSAVRADLTVTYGLAKPGHYLHGGPTVGKLAVVDISIPEQVLKHASLQGKVLDRQSTAELLLPRYAATHKGTFGHLLILAGSEGKTGAAILAGKGALRSGCGLVTLAVPAELNPIFETSLPEAMTVPLPHSAKAFSMADYDLLRELLVDKNALVIGPGIGTDPDTGLLVRRLYKELNLPMVIDADALNLLTEEPDCLTESGGLRILTPHPGEMSRLVGKTVAEIQADRLLAASWLTDAELKNNHEIITILKGAGTVLCSSNGQWAINSSGNNGMATGGMGDVLSGLIGGLLVQGYRSCDASGIGVYLHGLAADLLAAERTYGFTASEVANALPDALMQVSSAVRHKDCVCYSDE
jgi:NAD(P)H-hydrate epimerase